MRVCVYLSSEALKSCRAFACVYFLVPSNLTFPSPLLPPPSAFHPTTRLFLFPLAFSFLLPIFPFLFYLSLSSFAICVFFFYSDSLRLDASMPRCLVCSSARAMCDQQLERFIKHTSHIAYHMSHRLTISPSDDQSSGM
mmetsp:Transcript_30089/g.77621  ORF Transcript_30089/g.77621 Transcript_30089/m.77621 type:complete len:139 (+) Transcript_30089:526-942(+)